MSPRVSLVIPSYNAADYIGMTLNYVIKQTLRDFECIVVNDGSTDNSKQIIQKFAQSDKRIRYIEHRANSHVSAARNTGIRAAIGEYICFLDADDLITENSLETRLNTCNAALKVSDRYAGCYSASRPISEDADHPGESTPVELGDIGFMTVSGRCPFNANQPMLRTEIVRAIGGFSEAMSQAEDYNLWMMILRAGYWFAPSKFRSVTYRTRSSSLVRTAPLHHLMRSIQLLDHANAPLPRNQLTCSPYRLTKPLSEYEKQYNRAKRILEFSGMALVLQGEGAVATTTELVKNNLPDLSAIFPHRQAVINVLVSGGRRANQALSDDRVRWLSSITERLYEESMIVSHQESSAVDNSPFGNSDLRACRIWDDGYKDNVDVAFFPHKDYHVWTIALIGEELRKAGIRYVVVDITAQWREAGTRSKAAESGIELLGLGEFILNEYKPRSVVVFNDWDHITRPIVVAANDAGIPTVSIVEGIQDYDDADTGRQRQAYKCTNVVLLPGEFDAKYFKSSKQTCVPIGIPRITSLRTAATVAPKNSVPRVLINSNFSYGVLEDCRDSWLSAAVNAVLELGYQPVISRHPADRGVLFSEYQTKNDFYTELELCDITIQRFASGVLEALARGRGVLYFNPHGEKVDKFTTDPKGAFCIVNSEIELRQELRAWTGWVAAAKSNGDLFLDLHAGPKNLNVGKEICNVLSGLIDAAAAAPDFDRFFYNLKVIDFETSSLFLAVRNGKQLFDDVVTASTKLNVLRDKWHTVASRYLSSKLKRHSNFNRNLSKKRPSCKISETPDSSSIVVSDPTFYLSNLTRELLLNPSTGLARLEEPSVAQEVAGALAAMAEDDPLAVHFRRVEAFARSRAALQNVP